MQLKSLHKSFESSQRSMMMGSQISALEDMVNFEAEITDNPLKNAFRGKATVHTHIPGQSYVGDEAISVIKNQYKNSRQGTSLAYIC